MTYPRAFGIVVAFLILAGCSRTTNGAGLARPVLPVLPASLSNLCTPPPTVLVSEELQVAVGKARRALGRCSRRHRDLVLFYDGLRAELK